MGQLYIMGKLLEHSLLPAETCKKKTKASVHKTCLYTYKRPACRNLLRDIDCAATSNSPCRCESHHLPQQLRTCRLLWEGVLDFGVKFLILILHVGEHPTYLSDESYPCWPKVVLFLKQNAQMLLRRLHSESNK